jgi:hypothetical protein
MNDDDDDDDDDDDVYDYECSAICGKRTDTVNQSTRRKPALALLDLP